MKFLRRLGNVAMGFVALILSVLLQAILYIPVYIYYITYSNIKGAANNEDMLSIIENMLRSIVNMDLIVYSTVAWGICGIFVFYLWYKRVTSTTPKVSFKRDISAYTIFGILLIALGSQLFVNYICNILSTVFTDEFNYFANLFDTSTLSVLATYILLFYGIFIAPIHEEILFRGVIFHYMQKGCPFLIANILQAALFGLLHMNIVQGTYAFLIGLLLGYIYKRSRNLTATIIIHLVFNIIGSFPILKMLPENNISLNLTAAFVGLVVVTLGCVLYNYYIKERDLKLNLKENIQ